MPSFKYPGAPADRLRTSQLINGALVSGVVTFLGIALFMRLTDHMGPPRAEPIVSYIAVAAAAIVLVLHRVVPDLVLRGIRRQLAGRPPMSTDDETTALWGIFQTWHLIGLALLEGGCFLLLIGYMVEGFVATLPVVGLLLALMLAKFPTEAGVERWVDTQRDLLEQDRRDRQM